MRDTEGPELKNLCKSASSVVKKRLRSNQLMCSYATYVVQKILDLLHRL